MTDWNDPSSFAHNTIEIEGLPIHYVEAGKGPLVLLLHGFPYTWFEWRHQIGPLAAAGYRVVAPDIRGFGQSGKPARAQDYTMLHSAGDVVGLVAALGEPGAVLVGHDLGAWVAAAAVRLRPDLFRALAILSTPVGPREAVRPSLGWERIERERGGKMHHHYFQEPGRAERELDADIASSLRGIYHAISGDARGAERWRLLTRPGETICDTMPDPGADRLPAWLPQRVLDEYVRQYAETGFAPPLAHYRCRELTWELTASWSGQQITCPSMFIGGDADPALELIRAQYDELERTYTDLRIKTLLSGIGHGAPEEAPQAVTEALLQFLSGLGDGG